AAGATTTTSVFFAAFISEAFAALDGRATAIEVIPTMARTPAHALAIHIPRARFERRPGTANGSDSIGSRTLVSSATGQPTSVATTRLLGSTAASTGAPTGNIFWFGSLSTTELIAC